MRNFAVANSDEISGTLLEQRSLAHSKHDHIRKALICEPRGHREMYGAVLRPRTELTESEQAYIGVLFLTNEGYSTMCGHATLALGRLLVDHAGSAHVKIRRDFRSLADEEDAELLEALQYDLKQKASELGGRSLMDWLLSMCFKREEWRASY